MLPKLNAQNTELIVDMLVSKRYEKKCDELDDKLENALRIAFEGERISSQRAERIVEKFCKVLKDRG